MVSCYYFNCFQFLQISFNLWMQSGEGMVTSLKQPGQQQLRLDTYHCLFLYLVVMNPKTYKSLKSFRFYMHVHDLYDATIIVKLKSIPFPLIWNMWLEIILLIGKFIWWVGSEGAWAGSLFPRRTIRRWCLEQLCDYSYVDNKNSCVFFLRQKLYKYLFIFKTKNKKDHTCQYLPCIIWASNILRNMYLNHSCIVHFIGQP